MTMAITQLEKVYMLRKLIMLRKLNYDNNFWYPWIIQKELFMNYSKKKYSWIIQKEPSE